MQEYTEFRKKESKIFSNFKLMAQKKKQDHSTIVLTRNTANYKDIQQNSFFLFSKLPKYD